MSGNTLTMPQWTGCDYIGERYDDYLVLASQHRDSTLMEQSNFDVALIRMGGESDTVKVVRFAHWAVGWVDQLLICHTDMAMVQQGNAILAALEEYPVLDEDDYNARVAAKRDEYRQEIMSNKALWDYDTIIAEYGDLELYLDDLQY